MADGRRAGHPRAPSPHPPTPAPRPTGAPRKARVVPSGQGRGHGQQGRPPAQSQSFPECLRVPCGIGEVRAAPTPPLASGRKRPGRCVVPGLGSAGRRKDPELRAPSGQGLKSRAGGAGELSLPPRGVGRGGLQEVGNVQGGQGGRGRWRFRPGQNESCKLQPASRGETALVGRQVVSCQREGGGIPSRSRKDFDVHLPTLPAPSFGTCQPRPQSPGQPPRLHSTWFGESGTSALPTLPTPQGPHTGWTLFALFLEMSSLSRSYSFQSKGQVRKITDSFFPPANEVACFAGKVLQAHDVSDAGRRPHCLGCLIGGL